MTLLALLKVVLLSAAALSALFLILSALVCVKLLFFTKNQSYQDSLDILAQKGTLYTDIIPTDILERIEITGVNGTPLIGYFANLFPGSNKTVVLVHGIRASHIIGLQYAPLFTAHGYNLLAIDQRAHGLSGGRACSYGYFEKSDLSAWLSYLRQRLGDNAEFGLMGHSMGAATVLSVAEHRQDIRFIVADCPFDRLNDFILYQLRRLGVFARPVYALVRLIVRLFLSFDPNSVAPIQTAFGAGRDIPTLFIHSKGDRIIPYSCAHRMYEAKNNPLDRLYIHVNAAHPDVYAIDKEHYKKQLDEFLNGFK